MSFKYLRKIPSADEIRNEMPVDSNIKAIKSERDILINGVITGKNNKFLIIIGPCSADNEDAVCEYTGRLAKLQEKVKDIFVLVPRLYTNKPRTTGEGYKGMAHQPIPGEEPNIVEGIKAIRRLHLRVIKETGLSSADEMLYPDNYAYLEELLSYVAIGARSVENQQHRLTVSGLDVPIGMKNPTSGDLTVLLNSVQAAITSHIFKYNGYEVETEGNPLAHCILRGAVNSHGKNIPNYHYEDISRLIEMHNERFGREPAIIIDTNHANSGKKHKDQPRIAMEVMFSMMESDAIRRSVKGLMIESYLLEGSQSIQDNIYGKSITDPCLGWEDSERLILDLADYYSKF